LRMERWPDIALDSACPSSMRTTTDVAAVRTVAAR
jgi:hypothetical protein